MTAMFNKFCVNNACQALQYLATMRPNLVIPNMLERMQSTFDSLTEPHKLTASMICMVAVARPMVQGSRNINKGIKFVLPVVLCKIIWILKLKTTIKYFLIKILLKLGVSFFLVYKFTQVHTKSFLRVCSINYINILLKNIFILMYVARIFVTYFLSSDVINSIWL